MPLRYLSRWLALLLLGHLVAVPGARALDQVKLVRGTITNGTVESSSPTEVTVKLTSGSVDTIPVNEIDSIKYHGEPAQLNVARQAAAGGRYEDALRVLEKVAGDKKLEDRPELTQDLQFYQALCAARLALAGTGDVLTAGKQMNEFVQKNPKSYHALAANEVLAELLLAIDKYDQAQKVYASIEKQAPWNDVKMRVRVAKGNVLRGQGKDQEALAEFDAALALAPADQTTGPIAQLRQLAMLGRATCLADQGKTDEALAVAEGVIRDADPEQAELCGRAYNTLGTCLKKAGRDKDALLAFLHVDLLYPGNPLVHAEALRNLVDLWPAVGQPQHAVEAQELLRSRYKNTRWAKG